MASFSRRSYLLDRGTNNFSTPELPKLFAHKRTQETGSPCDHYPLFLPKGHDFTRAKSADSFKFHPFHADSQLSEILLTRLSALFNKELNLIRFCSLIS